MKAHFSKKEIPKWKPKTSKYQNESPFFCNKGGTKMDAFFPKKRFPKWKPKNVQIPKWKPKIFLNKGGTKMEAQFSKKEILKMETQKRPNTKMETQNVFKQRWCQNGSDFVPKKKFPTWKPKSVQIPK